MRENCKRTRRLTFAKGKVFHRANCVGCRWRREYKSFPVGSDWRSIKARGLIPSPYKQLTYMYCTGINTSEPVHHRKHLESVLRAGEPFWVSGWKVLIFTLPVFSGSVKFFVLNMVYRKVYRVASVYIYTGWQKNPTFTSWFYIMNLLEENPLWSSFPNSGLPLTRGVSCFCFQHSLPPSLGDRGFSSWTLFHNVIFSPCLPRSCLPILFPCAPLTIQSRVRKEILPVTGLCFFCLVVYQVAKNTVLILSPKTYKSHVALWPQ